MPERPDALSLRVAGVSGFYLSDATVEETLRRVADLANETIRGSDMVGVSTTGHSSTTVGTHRDVSDLDQVQYRAGSGPVLDAVRSASVQRVDSMRDCGRWPAFAAAATGKGVLASLSWPLMAGEAVIGTLNCYSRTSGRFSIDEERIGWEFAEAAAIALGNAQAYRDAGQTDEDLRLAHLSQATSQQAGVVISDEMLVRATQREHRKLRDVADQIVDRCWEAIERASRIRAPIIQEVHMNTTDNIDNDGSDDDRVLDLRVGGKSFVGIAKLLGLGRPSRANEAFNRALRRKPAGERDILRRQELIRLDVLADGVRANRDLAPDDVARRLRTVARLRAMLVAV